MQDHNQDESADRRLVGISRRDASTCDTVETESSSKVVQGRDRQHSAGKIHHSNNNNFWNVYVANFVCQLLLLYMQKTTCSQTQ